VSGLIGQSAAGGWHAHLCIYTPLCARRAGIRGTSGLSGNVSRATCPGQPGNGQKSEQGNWSCSPSAPQCGPSTLGLACWRPRCEYLSISQGFSSGPVHRDNRYVILYSGMQMCMDVSGCVVRDVSATCRTAHNAEPGSNWVMSYAVILGW